MSEINAISSIEQQNISNIKSNNKVSSNKTNFSSFLGESQTMNDIFDKAAQKYNVSVELLKGIGKAESDFNANAVSRCGAQGVMQLMPATAAELGVTDSFDAEQNIMGGAKYISGLLKKYDGNTQLALAAYNAGSGNVAKYGGIPPFEETQNYVVKVTNYMKQSLNADVEVAPSKAAKANNTNSATISTNFLVESSESVKAANITEFYDEIFSYPDYLKFLDLLLEEENEEKASDEKEVSNHSAIQQINYNIPVMNLLNSMN